MFRMKKFYITTSIPYTNAPPHIGFALEAVQADVLSRYHKKLGEDVFYLTGVDEHGLKIKKAAQKAGKTSQQFVDEISAEYLKLTKALNISNNDFIRTTDKERHKPTVEKVWLKLKGAGDIYKKKYKGYYCSGCEAFITKKDLINGECPNHKKKPEIIEEENYFFKLSKYLPRIKEKIESNQLKIVPQTRKNEVLGYIKQGIEDVSFSRSKEKYWGFEVPDDKNQIIYVWADALPNYFSGIGYTQNPKKFGKYWPADVHCIGKDILKFHALIWPAMILSLKLPLPKTIFVHGFINVAGEKMSKSLGNTVNPFKLIEKYGTDAVRYYLLREISPTEDGDFTIEKFKVRYNSDLASGIGNLVARVRAMAERIGFDKCNIVIEKEVEKNKKLYKKALEEFKFNEALKAVWKLIGFCDRYIEKERPWECGDREAKIKNQKVLGNLLFAIDEIAGLLEPFLPETSKKIRREISGKDLKKSKEKKLLFERI